MTRPLMCTQCFKDFAHDDGFCSDTCQKAYDAEIGPVGDWVVSRWVDHGPGHYYRYTVEGENLNHAPESPDRKFVWRIPESPESEARYDMTHAKKVDSL